MLLLFNHFDFSFHFFDEKSVWLWHLLVFLFDSIKRIDTFIENRFSYFLSFYLAN
jgi:hypothetical protein